MPSTNQSRFATIPDARIQRSTFDRSHGYKTTFDSAQLIPCFVDEVLPGDTFDISMNHFVRMTTPIVPFMDNLYFDVQFFFVPNRLVWDNWEKFNGARDNPGDSTDYIIPKQEVPAGGFAVGSRADYFGLPTEVDILPDDWPSALPFRAYNLIYNEWYRDENIVVSLIVDTGDGPDPDTIPNLVTYARGKRKDYFTSCLPWPQKGEAVELPIGGLAPIIGFGRGAFQSDLILQQSTETGGATRTYADAIAGSGMVAETTGPGGSPLIYANLGESTAITINAMREAFQLQRMLERDARGGTRYIEVILAHFGVTNPDFRLQRPEYLGGYSSRVSVNPVAQTSSTDTETPQGNLAAVAHSSGSKKVCKHSFTEHGYIIGLMSVRADLTYQQGMERFWSRQTRYDFYWPALAHLGEQAVLNKEIYTQGTAEDNEVFGYQERYAEYRYKPSKITGQFRSSFAQSLDIWHLSQDFTALPALNIPFILENPPVERVLAVQDYPQFFGDFWFNFKCTRPMPVYSVPGLIDHF